MDEIIKMGEGILKYADVMGEFLLSTPLKFVSDAFRENIISGILPSDSWINDAIIMICDQSIATWVISGAIAGVLVYRVVKFFVGIITGS